MSIEVTEELLRQLEAGYWNSLQGRETAQALVAEIRRLRAVVEAMRAEPRQAWLLRCEAAIQQETSRMANSLRSGDPQADAP